MPQRSAEPEEAQAFSILIAGAGKSPAQLAAIGAVWAWCSYASLICQMKAAWMSLLGSSFSTLWNADRAAQRRVRGHRPLLAGRTWIRRLILWWLRASRAMIPDSLGRALVKMTFRQDSMIA